MRDLLARIAEGNQEAFETLFRKMSKRVFAFVRRGMDHPAQAEEIMVDTLYEVWKHPERFRGSSRVSSWIFGIARNKMLMVLREDRKRTHEDIEDFVDLPDNDCPDALALLEERQRQTLLRNCMRRLSWIHRECLHLFYFEDYSIAEIAAFLKIPPGTAKSRLSHARAHLKSCIAQEYGDMAQKEDGRPQDAI
jgi:RNA polymerase sigma-70 factor (ECF subfamily)